MGAAAVDVYYTTSPAIADAVAERPWLAFVVRVVLTPVAWALASPHVFLGMVGFLTMLAVYYRRTRRLRALGA
jgi:hypothetical protein